MHSILNSPKLIGETHTIGTIFSINKATCAEECSTQLHDTMAMNYKNLLKTTNQKLNGMYILSFMLKFQSYDRAAVLKSYVNLRSYNLFNSIQSFT